MGLTRALTNVASQEVRGADPTQPWGSWYIPRNGELGFQAAGVTVSDETALGIDTVASCLRLGSDTVSSLPLYTLKKTKDRSKKLIDPPPALIMNPWPDGGTLQDWLVQVIFSLGLRGNFFGQIVARDNDGYPTMIMPVHPDDVFARRDAKSGKRVYKFRGKLIDNADVFHIPSSLLPPGGFIGLNPVEYRRRSWGLALAAEQYGGEFFANSAQPSGIISLEQELSEDETLEMIRAWRQAHGGIDKAQLPAILSGGAKWQQIQLAPDDAQFLQTRQLQREQIIAWFGIPPHRIGIADRTPMSGMTWEDQERQFMIDAIVGPYTSRIESYLSLPTITRPSQTIRFDFSQRLRSNTLQLMQAAQLGVNTGQWMADEARAMLDMEPLPNKLGRIIGRPMNNQYFDADTGQALTVADPSLNPPNPGGFGGGGGNPDNSDDGSTAGDGSDF